MANIFRRKPLHLIVSEAKEEGDEHLKRSLGPVSLTALGVGAVIGAGIFVMAGLGAHEAGPALTLSFLMCGVACTFAGLCYAEFAAMIPLAGSAYTYSYATLGELFALSLIHISACIQIACPNWAHRIDQDVRHSRLIHSVV